MRAPGPRPSKPYHPLHGRTRPVWWHRPCIGPHWKGASTSMHNGEDGSTDVGLEVFSTCTQSTDGIPEAYAQRVPDVARWSEQAGCKGILVYSDNRLVDAWLASHIIIQNTTRLCPLVDRKSTRLNSGHPSISYAVFCLKKKKKKKTQISPT